MSSAGKYLSLVKFEHSIFALPFAYAATILASQLTSARVDASIVIWITVAMVSARTFAMTMNRLIDAAIDARNPRTASREIPAGVVGRSNAVAFAALAILVLLAATTQLDPITRWLWPIPVALFVVYPYTKRFTWLCHGVLGCCTGLAPVGAWLAITGTLEATPILMTLASATWVAGFDIIYATGDTEFDRANHLSSIPVRFGIARGLLITRGLHLCTTALLAGVGMAASLSLWYWIGLTIVAMLLAYENAIVSAADLTRVNAAFFTTNGVIGMVLLAAVAAGTWL